MDVVEAKINKEWAVRLGIIAAMFIGGGCWFLYDGLVAYPEINRRFELTHYQDDNGAWRPYAEYNPGEMTESQWQTRLRESLQRLEDAGYDPQLYDSPDDQALRDLPPKPKQEFTQLIIAACCFPIGLLALGALGINARRRVVADEEKVSFAGDTMRYEEISDIDKSRWDSKGIVVLQAGEKRMKLDDWKFRGVTAVLERIEDRRAGGEPDEEPVA